MIEIVNKRTHTPTDHDVYCGRGSSLGNPYTHMRGPTKALYVCSTRQESIEKYRTWLLQKIVRHDEEVCRALNSIYRMAKNGGVNLVCFCVPLDCHGAVIKEIVETKMVEILGWITPPETDSV